MQATVRSSRLTVLAAHVYGAPAAVVKQDVLGVLHREKVDGTRMVRPGRLAAL